MTLAIGYIIGCIPTGGLVRRYRAQGKTQRGVLGALNSVFRFIFGSLLDQMPAHWSETILDSWPIVLLNFIKGASVSYLAYQVVGSNTSAVLTGLMTIWGHTWPVFNRFRGERGISVILGVATIVAPKSTVAWCFFWMIAFALVRYAAVASVLSFLMLPLILWSVKHHDLFVVFGVIASLMAIAQLFPDLHRIYLGKTKPADEGGLLSEGDIEDEEEERDEPTRWARFRARLAIGFLALLIATFWFANKYVYRGFGMQVPIIRSGGPYYKTVALTFDDGPDPDWTPRILDALRDSGVKATFFIVGQHAQQYPDIVKRIAAEGHEIGSHSYAHPFNLILISKSRMQQEILKSEQTIEKITGQRPYLFRPPRGIYNMSVMSFLTERKYTMVLWTLSSRDWQEPSYKEITWRVTNEVKSGDILLFHDSGSILMPEGGNRLCTVQALPYIIKDLKERGYRFVTISDMIIMSDLDGNIQ